MTSQTRRFLLLVFGLAFSSVAYSQGGGFGGGQAGGGGIFGSNTGSQREASLAGTWTLEIELEFDALNREATGESLRVRADVTLIGAEVNGRFRPPIEGEFSCTVIDQSERCQRGRLLILWPGANLRESGDFEFVVDNIDGRRAKGEATFTDPETGAIRLYSVEMRKR